MILRAGPISPPAGERQSFARLRDCTHAPTSIARNRAIDAAGRDEPGHPKAATVRFDLHRAAGSAVITLAVLLARLNEKWATHRSPSDLSREPPAISR
jgi:hypothetical protein